MKIRLEDVYTHLNFLTFPTLLPVGTQVPELGHHVMRRVRMNELFYPCPSELGNGKTKQVMCYYLFVSIFFKYFYIILLYIL